MCSNEPMVVQCPTERGRCVQDHSITASCVPVSVNVTTAYGNHEHVAATATVVTGVLAFTFQIYCDFSGYTDIARGVARLMGFEFALNFRLPYFATNPSDFWRRWHISLSSWLADYLYKPLGGNRGSRWMTSRSSLARCCAKARVRATDCAWLLVQSASVLSPPAATQRNSAGSRSPMAVHSCA